MDMSEAPNSKQQADSGVVHRIDSESVVITGDHNAVIITSTITSSNKEILKWWQEFKGSNSYPIYCIFFMTISDTESLAFVEKYRNELSTISGKNCLILYFS